MEIDTTSRKRIRASRTAIEVAITAAQHCGLSVCSMKINGSSIEVEFDPTNNLCPEPKIEGLKKWE